MVFCNLFYLFCTNIYSNWNYICTFFIQQIKRINNIALFGNVVVVKLEIRIWLGLCIHPPLIPQKKCYYGIAIRYTYCYYFYCFRMQPAIYSGLDEGVLMWLINCSQPLPIFQYDSCRNEVTMREPKMRSSLPVWCWFGGNATISVLSSLR